jgi:hypothetical protein
MGSLAIVQQLGKGLNNDYNAASAAGNNGVIDRQQDLLKQIGYANEKVSSNIANQDAFAKALLAQTQGAGPNLAAAQLANATGQNVANQAALMASQRGTGSNAGLIARQAAQQGAGIQQQAAGQAAVNRMQQQLNTQGLLGGVYGNIGQEAGQNLATQQQAQAAQNQAISGATSSANQINAGIAEQNKNRQMQMISGIGQAAAGMLAKGGEVENQNNSSLDSHLKSVLDIYHPTTNNSSQMYAKGGKVDAMVSPGEKFLKPKEVKEVAKGKANPMKVGETIPGKPKVPGAIDSYKNDTVPKKLETGGIVIPRHVTQSADPVGESMKFVKAILAKKRHGVK